MAKEVHENPGHLYTLQECAKLVKRSYVYLRKLYKHDLLPNPLNTVTTHGPNGRIFRKRLFTLQEVYNIRDRLRSPFFINTIAQKRGLQKGHAAVTGKSEPRKCKAKSR